MMQQNIAVYATQPGSDTHQTEQPGLELLSSSFMIQRLSQILFHFLLNLFIDIIILGFYAIEILHVSRSEAHTHTRDSQTD
jgi:hypothetical protein